MKFLIYVILLLHPVFMVNCTFGFSEKSNIEQKNRLHFHKKKQVSAQQLIQNKAFFNLRAADDLQLKSKNTDALGFVHYRYQQSYQNIPVEGTQYILHEKKGLVESANGHLIENINLDIIPTISKAAALQLALSSTMAKIYAWQDVQHEKTLQQIQQNEQATFYPEGALVILNPSYTDNAENCRLAYKFDVYALEPLFRKWIYIDAQTGEVLSSVNKIHTCNHSSATGETNYSGQVNFSACFDGGQYHLKNTLDCDIQVFNSNQSKTYTPVEFKQDGNYFDQDPSAVEVFWASRKIYEYFLTEFEQEGLDGSNMPIHSWVNYGDNFNNAYWNGSWLTFGNGDGESYGPFTSPDIIAHEITHGITDYSAGLSYYGESGALNESFSDIFGEVMEYYLTGSNDWIVGADIVIEPGKAGLRSLSNPTDITMMTQQPDAYEGHYWYEGLGDNQGVHINSGVQNYWFYLLSEGGNVTNYFGDRFEIQGIGIENAAAIAHYSLTNFLTENATYDDARYWSIEAAKDLFPNNVNIEIQTKTAWCAVNVGFACPSLPDNAVCDRRADSLALVALYNSTNGNNWTNNWNLNQPMINWLGVSLDSKGCVIFLNLINNNLNGTIPLELGDLSLVKEISLNQNNLTGIIPSQLGNLRYLKKLKLSQNNLSGIIPSTIGSLSKLTTLELSQNKLSGFLPYQLNQLGDLLQLRVVDNKLSGNLPDLSYLQNLKEFAVSRNNFTGSIPAGFSNMISLAHLRLNDNNFEGCYSGNLVSICSHLDKLTNHNPYITQGNNFDDSWDNFCLNGAGSCGKAPIGPVYPGDFNQNGLVEVSDLLFWGLAAGESGEARPNSSTAWSAQDCPEWQNFINGVNSKHQDGNGDGMVNDLDISVLTQNYGLGTINSNAFNIGSPIRYKLEPISSVKNDDEITLIYELQVESLIDQPISAHGFACTINFNDLPVNDLDVDFSNSCLDNTENIDIYDISNNKLNIAITKSDKNNQLCSEPLGRVVVVTEDVIQSGEPYKININNGSTISNTGVLSSAISQSLYGVLSFEQNATNTFATHIQTTDEQCNGLGSATADVTGGVTPYTYQWSNGATSATVDNLIAGSYVVTVNDAVGNSSTIDIEIKEAISVYDTQTGKLLCGQACEQFLQPTGSVDSGFYPAQNMLESNGTLSPNSQVTFQAGDRIRLNTGFSSRQADKFSAKIGDCNP